MGRIWQCVLACLKRLFCRSDGPDGAAQRKVQLLKHFLAQLADEFLYAKNHPPAKPKVKTRRLRRASSSSLP